LSYGGKLLFAATPVYRVFRFCLGLSLGHRIDALKSASTNGLFLLHFFFFAHNLELPLGFEPRSDAYQAPALTSYATAAKSI
jgi:hypothetical protein